MRNFIKPFANLIIIFLLAQACKVADPPAMPEFMSMPDSYLGMSDSSSMAVVDRRSFFADTFLIYLIDTALQNNPDLQMAMQRIEVARAGVKMRHGELYPSVNTAVRAGFDKFSDYTMDGVGNYDTNLSDNVSGDLLIPNPTPDFFVGLQSSWEVDIWNKLRNRKKASMARLRAAELEQKLAETLLVAEVASLYYQLLALDNELEVISENISLQETAVELITLQKIGGRATELAVNQFNAQLLNTQALEQGIQQQIIETENQLNTLLGRFAGKIDRGEPIAAQQLPEVLEIGIPSDLLLYRPDIRQAEMELLAAEVDVLAARAEFFPSLTLTPYLGLQAFRAALLFDGPASVATGMMTGLTAPVFNRFQISAAYDQSVAGQRLAFYDYQKAIISGFNEVYTSLKQIENLAEMVEYKENEVEVLEQGVSIANDLFLGGYATYLEVITAQGRVLESQLALTNLRREQFLSIIQLYRTLGGGWEKDSTPES
ncbi:MAG: efflux transporter outer membrane subunit [Cyclobacteriaceae bacterium]